LWPEGLIIGDRRPICFPGANGAIEQEMTIVKDNKKVYKERWVLFFLGSEGYLLQGTAFPESWRFNERFIDSVIYSFTFD